MRILVAPDKFKGSLGAAEVAQEIAAGLRDVWPEAEITVLPVADGGEGTARVICDAAGGEWHSCEVHDPVGRIVTARYGTIEKGATAVMEMSEASGLWRLAPNERDPILANSFGTGEMLLDAVRRGVREIIIGLGGSATNDGGFGLARALGFRFYDSRRAELVTTVDELSRLARIEAPASVHLPPITAAVDVRNPLLGARGATRVFGPQKGATPSQVERLEGALERLADIVAHDLGCDHRNVPGSGAAGGLGFGLMSFCGATMGSGFDVVAERTGLEDAVRNADVVVTGEGRLDGQTLEGKAPAGVAHLARKYGRPVYAIVGQNRADSETCALFDAVSELRSGGIDEAESVARARELLRECARDLARQLRGTLRA